MRKSTLSLFFIALCFLAAIFWDTLLYGIVPYIGNLYFHFAEFNRVNFEERGMTHRAAITFGWGIVLFTIILILMYHKEWKKNKKER
jgi:hypothetical protein